MDLAMEWVTDRRSPARTLMTSLARRAGQLERGGSIMAGRAGGLRRRRQRGHVRSVQIDVARVASGRRAAARSSMRGMIEPGAHRPRRGEPRDLAIEREALAMAALAGAEQRRGAAGHRVACVAGAGAVAARWPQLGR